jgi:DHA2 family methylenomycin A resistance protein-like MFS transporter
MVHGGTKHRGAGKSTMFCMHSPKTLFTPALARIVATVSVGFVVTQLDVTIVNIALANLGAELHTNVSGLQWIVDAYTLAFVVLMLSFGMLGDRLGARRLYASGITLFALASLAPTRPGLARSRESRQQ